MRVAPLNGWARVAMQKPPYGFHFLGQPHKFRIKMNKNAGW